MYGRQTECALAAMGRLAVAYDGGKTHLSAADISRSCGLNTTSVIKVLAVLTRWGLLTRTRGPGGGSTLARDPKTITLFDVFKLFELTAGDPQCPFRDSRGGESACPLGPQLKTVQEVLDDFLHDTTFEVFRRVPETEWRSPHASKANRATHRRKSYRAPNSKTSKTMMFHCLLSH